MKTCFDTSVLVAALLQRHPHHAIAFPYLERVHQGRLEGCLTTHGLAELYATLTALPLQPRLQPAEVLHLVERSVLGRLTLLALDAGDYADALALTARRNLASGAVYDALHWVGAIRAGCSALLTLNLRHFQALAPGDPRIRTP